MLSEKQYELDCFKPITNLEKKVSIGDRDYEIIQIGDRLWMNENLKLEINKGCIIKNGNYYYNDQGLRIINKILGNWKVPNDEDYKELKEFIEVPKRAEIIKVGFCGYIDKWGGLINNCDCKPIMNTAYREGPFSGFIVQYDKNRRFGQDYQILTYGTDGYNSPSYPVRLVKRINQK